MDIRNRKLKQFADGDRRARVDAERMRPDHRSSTAVSAISSPELTGASSNIQLSSSVSVLSSELAGTPVTPVRLGLERLRLGERPLSLSSTSVSLSELADTSTPSLGRSESERLRLGERHLSLSSMSVSLSELADTSTPSLGQSESERTRLPVRRDTGSRFD